MSRGFQLISAQDLQKSELLAQMHDLRRRVFQEELKWTVGFDVINDFEVDEYDQPHAYYILHINDKGEVDATCRLISTQHAYMLADYYADFVQDIALPRTDQVWEITRFCASAEVRQTSRGRIVGELVAAVIEFGLIHGIKNYVALATDKIIPVIERMAGWDPQPIGPKKVTPDDEAYAIIYTVSEDMLARVRQKNKITGSLFNMEMKKNHSKNNHRERFPQEKPPSITRIPRQINASGALLHKGQPIKMPTQDIEKTVSYLEAVAFARGYTPLVASLRVTRMLMKCDELNTPELSQGKDEALNTLSDTYEMLKTLINKVDYDTHTPPQS